MHKPSEKTHRMKPLEGLNLTPMIDMVATLMFFLMIFAGILPVVIIEAPQPKIASTAEEIKMAQDTSNKLDLNVYISKTGFTVKSAFGSSQTFPLGQDGKFPYDALHKFLVELHQKRPTEKEITIMPTEDTPYELMVGVMDASRNLVKGDQGYKELPPDIAKKPESVQFNQLFPDVSIGGV